MIDSATPLAPREFSNVDRYRSFVMLSILAVIAAGYWFLLPMVQALILPTAPGGANGPWVVRPILAVRFCATAVLCALTAPAIAWPLQWIWNNEDAEAGTRYDPFAGQPGKQFRLIVVSLFLFLVYASGLVFYLLSWTRIGPDGIEQRVPWTVRRYAFHDIVRLEMIPEGRRSASKKQAGPWYSVRFPNDGSITFGADNEGCTSEELRRIADYIAERSNRAWVKYHDAQ